MKNFPGSKALLVSFVFFVCLSSGTMQAADPPKREPAVKDVKKAAEAIAEDFASFIPAKADVFVRPFTVLGANSDLALPFHVAEALRKKGYNIQNGAKYEIGGNIKRAPVDETAPPTGVTIAATLNGKGIDNRVHVVLVDNANDAIALAEPTGEQRKAPSEDAPAPTSDPQVDRDNFVRPTKTSPYSIQILVIDPNGKVVDKDPSGKIFHYTVVPVTRREGGNLYVGLKKGNEFVIRIRNSTKFEAAAGVYLDGLTRFISADNPNLRNSVDIIKPNGDQFIRGYFKDGKSVNAFVVGDFGSSVVASLKLPEIKEGNTIKITFAAAWEKEQTEPPHETGPAESSGINAGGPRADPTNHVERVVGNQRAAIRLYYGE